MNKQLNKSVVVSRFNEVPDIYCKIFELIKESDEKGFFSQTSLYFYNKGKPLQLEEVKRLQSYGFKSIDYIELPNVGREAHTWIYHMKENLRAREPESTNDLLYFIPASFSRKLKPLDSSDSLTPPNSQSLYSEYIITKVITSNYILKNPRCPFNVEENFVLEDWKGTDPDNLKDTAKQKYSLAKIRPFGKWVEELGSKLSEGNKIPYLHGYGNGLMGFLQTTRDRIDRYPYSFYEECEKELVESGENGELPHYWERAWATLFGIEKV